MGGLYCGAGGFVNFAMGVEMDFKTAKRIIRTELALASDEKLAEVIDAARAGKMPWANADICLATRLFGIGLYLTHEPRCHESCLAYCRIGYGAAPIGRTSEVMRQRIAMAMALAELRRRMRQPNLAAIEEVGTIAELMGERQ